MADWGHGLFSCMDDCGVCIITWLLPCITFGQNAEAVGETSCLMGALALFVPLLDIYCLWKVRGAVREKYGIEGSVINDLICVLLCPLCTIIQEAQQIKEGGGGAMARA